MNIYIIIAWHDWRYGGSYSTRALMQSYPVFALPFAALIEKINVQKWRFLFYALCGYLLLVNLFQIYQYNRTILHYNDMNRRYYSRIYLNPNPTPADMSLLDSNEILSDESGYNRKTVILTDSAAPVHFSACSSAVLVQTSLNDSTGQHRATDSWLKIACEIKAPDCLWQSYLNADLVQGDSVKHATTRLFSPISKNDAANKYAFYMRVPEYFEHGRIKLYITSAFNFEGTVEEIKVTELEK